jgi:hypothetical protein
VDGREDRFLLLFPYVRFSQFFFLVSFRLVFFFSPRLFTPAKKQRDAFISDEFMPLFIRTRRVSVRRNPTTHLPRAILRLVEVSGLHFFMPDYPCLFVFREADRDFEIKAWKPDKAGPRDILVFLRILKGVNLL